MTTQHQAWVSIPSLTAPKAGGPSFNPLSKIMKSTCDWNTILVYHIKYMFCNNSNVCIWLSFSHLTKYIHRPHPVNKDIFSMWQNASVQFCQPVGMYHVVVLAQQVPLPCLLMFWDHKLYSVQLTIHWASSLWRLTCPAVSPLHHIQPNYSLSIAL